MICNTADQAGQNVGPDLFSKRLLATDTSRQRVTCIVIGYLSCLLRRMLFILKLPITNSVWTQMEQSDLGP